MKLTLNKNLFLRSNAEEYYLVYNEDKTYRINKSIFEILCIFEKKELSVQEACNEYIEIKKNLDKKKELQIIFENFVKQLLEKGFILDYESTHIPKSFIKDKYLDLKKKFPFEIHNSSNSLILSKNYNAKKCIKITKKKDDFNKKDNEIFFLKKLSKRKISPKPYAFEQNFIVTEYIKGKNLKKFIDDSHLSCELKCELFFQILKVYRILFNMKIHHGDIHFKNIMIRKKTFFKVMLIDFENTYFHDEKKENIVLGAINHFIPPELMNENCFNKMNDAINKQGEVYQLTLIFYYILHDKLPFKSQTWKELFYEVKFNNFPYDLNTNISKSIILFIKRGLSPNPNIRYNNIQEMYNFYKQNIYDKKN